ncbi:MAG TPA: hypothetical protein VD736_08110 [Nitrososphaera sp.]|nr:hypothetical protein [Nitrososphaera sp.]
MVEFSKNKWKYSTIGLLAVLAVGFSFPQAFAHVTSNVPHAFQHVLDALAPLQEDINDIKETTDELGLKFVSLNLFPDPSDGQTEEIVILPMV